MNKIGHRFTLFVFLVLLLGLLEVYSASSNWATFKYHDATYFVKRQIIFACIGILGYMMASKISLKRFQKWHSIILIFSFVLMILVLMIGVERNGSKSWFKIASFYLQPSEFLKFSMILTTSHILSMKKRILTMKDLFPLLMLVLSGFGLIMLQPDFGSGIVMLCSIVMMVFVAECPLSYFVKGGFVAALGLVGLILSAPYRLERITSFINPWQDPLGSGFQMIQSLYAIAPGGLFGRGFQSSIQKQFYLPEPQTDFIFSIFAEEFGFIGCVFLLFCYDMIIITGIEIAKKADNVFVSYAAFGILALFGIQVTINLGVVVGLFPITGET